MGSALPLAEPTCRCSEGSWPELSPVVPEIPVSTLRPYLWVGSALSTAPGRGSWELTPHSAHLCKSCLSTQRHRPKESRVPISAQQPPHGHTLGFSSPSEGPWETPLSFPLLLAQAGAESELGSARTFQLPWTQIIPFLRKLL